MTGAYGGVKIKGVVALVTGSNRGLGKAFVRGLLDAGAAKVYAAARNVNSVAECHATPSNSTFAMMTISRLQPTHSATSRCWLTTLASRDLLR